MVSRRTFWVVVTLAFALPLLFAGLTQHAWEDYFITLRASRNLVEGNGLVFTPGERLHTFTSPIGVLVPALCTAIAGLGHEDRALWLFRLINAVALAIAAGVVWRRAAKLGLGGVGRFVLFGLLLTDAKLTDFSINGMETALLVLGLVLLWSELESEQGPRLWPVAWLIAALMWTRPDAFVLAGALLIAHLCFRADRPTVPIPLRRLIGAGLLSILLYLPWLLFTWWYYGSPVPHTVVAKAAYTPPLSLHRLLLVPWESLKGDSMLPDLFMPSYWVFGGWPAGLRSLAHVLSAVAAFAWIAPRWSPAGRRASLALFIGMFYICSIILFPWYVPPWTVLAIITLAFIADRLHATAARWAWLASGWRVACVAVVLVQIAVLGAVTWQLRIHQRYVETGVRREIGEWLHAHAAPHDTVFMEPLGYIGYFSNLKTYDFPGLSSSEVVDVVRHGGKRYVDIISQLHPTWVVLRPAEWARPEFRAVPVIHNDYELVKAWDALPDLDAVKYLPGRPWSEWEARYLLFHRKPTAVTAPAKG